MHTWCRIKFYINVKYMLLFNKRYVLHCPNIYVDGKYTPYVDKVKYSGVILCDSNNDCKNTENQTRSFFARSNSLLRNFKYCSTQVKLFLVPIFLCNILLLSVVGSICHCGTNVNNRLRVAYNNSHILMLGYKRHDSASNICLYAIMKLIRLII